MSTSRKQKRSGPEWIAFGVSSAVLGVLVALIIGLWVTGEDRPAAFTVQQRRIEKRGDEYHVTAKVKNVGDRTAESVMVRAELTVGEEAPIESDQTIDFLSGGEVEEVGFVFTDDPATGELTVEVAGYSVP